MVEYDVSKNNMMILSVIIILLHKTVNKKMELIKLFILISILIDRRSDEGYKSKTNIEYFLKREEKDTSKYRIYFRIQENLNQYRNKVYESIGLGIKMGILAYEYNVSEQEIFLSIRDNYFISMPKSKILEHSDMIKNIDKLLKFTVTKSTAELIKVFKLEV